MGTLLKLYCAHILANKVWVSHTHTANKELIPAYRHGNYSVRFHRQFEWFLSSSNYTAQRVMKLSILLQPIFLFLLYLTHNLILLLCWSHFCAVFLVKINWYPDGSSIYIIWFRRRACGACDYFHVWPQNVKKWPKLV